MSKIIIFIVLLGCLSECAEENLRVPDEPQGKSYLLTEKKPEQSLDKPKQSIEKPSQPEKQKKETQKQEGQKEQSAEQTKTQQIEIKPNFSYFVDKCLFDHIFFFGAVGNTVIFILGCMIMTKLFATFGALFIISRLFDYSPNLGIILLLLSLYRYDEERNMHRY